MNVKVSIIVPIYGVEDFIERCARSLFEQTMKSDIEFIFVNDCTRDNSMIVLENIVKEYPERSNQIVILSHSDNKGLPQARLTGLNNAKGEYIWFVDSDDWIAFDGARKFYDVAKKEDSDVVICDYYISDGEVKSECHVIINPMSIFSDILMEKNNCSVWNKFVRKSLFSKYDVFFPTKNMGEDLVIMSQLFIHKLKVSKINKFLYFYYLNNASISLNQDNNSCIKRFNELKFNTKLLEQIIQRHRELKLYEDEMLYRKYAVIAQLMPIISKNNIYSLWINTYPEINIKSVFRSNFPIPMKIVYLIAYLKLYPIMIYILNKFKRI